MYTYLYLNIVMNFSNFMIDNTLLHIAESKEDAIRLINEYGVNVVNSYGDTVLHYCNNIEICRILIDNGADVHATNTTGMTPLHFALDHEIALELILNGACVNKKANLGLTPLHMSIDSEVAMVLIEYGADIDAIDNVGETPLHKFSNLSVMRLLVERGACIDPVNNDGNTPLLLNCRRFNMGLFGSSKIIRFLLDCGALSTSVDNLGLGIKDMNIHKAYVLVCMFQDHRTKNEMIILRNLDLKNYQERYIKNSYSKTITHDSEDIFRNIISYL